MTSWIQKIVDGVSLLIDTPQAKDDLFSSSATGITEDSAGVYHLNVMGNDLGGTAKRLWSLDNGVNNTGAIFGYVAGDLLNQDTARSQAGTSDTSLNGARIWITNDGRVGYDASTLSTSFKAQLQALGDGQSLIDTFTYAIRLANGTLSWATASIELKGSNDAAVIAGVTSGSVTEAGGVGNSVVGAPVTTGVLTAADVDNADNTFQAVTAETASAGGYGTYTVTTGGVWTYSLNNANNTVQALNAGQQLTDTFTVRTIDGTAQQVTVTISGTNDAAVISGDVTGAVVEAGSGNNGGTPTATGLLTNTDVDNAPNSFQAVATAAASDNGYGSYTLAANGSWTYTLDNANAAVEALDAGDTLTDSFTVYTIDGTAQQIAVTINGAPDVPVNQAPVAVDDVIDGVVGSGEAAIITFETYYIEYDVLTGFYRVFTDEGFLFADNGAGSDQQGNTVGGPNVSSSGWGADYSIALYSYGVEFNAYDTSTFALPIVMTRVDGEDFSVTSVNITSYNLGGNPEAVFHATVTGYLDGQQVAQQSFDVPDANYAEIVNNLVTLTDLGFGEVDRVVYTLTAENNDYIESYYDSDNDVYVTEQLQFAYQYIDNIQTGAAFRRPTEGRVLTGIDVLANDTDDGPQGDLSIAQFSATSALGAAVTLNPDGTFNYDPTAVASINALDAGESLVDTFTYVAQDAFGVLSNTATVTLNVQGANDDISPVGLLIA
jgi:VCBS repeat-containing protein